MESLIVRLFYMFTVIVVHSLLLLLLARVPYMVFIELATPLIGGGPIWGLSSGTLKKSYRISLVDELNSV